MRMLSHDPENRPSASEILESSIFKKDKAQKVRCTAGLFLRLATNNAVSFTKQMIEELRAKDEKLTEKDRTIQEQEQRIRQLEAELEKLRTEKLAMGKEG